MNNSGTICQCYISITCYIKCFFILLCGAVISTLIKRLILFVLKILTFVCLKNFISLYTILLIAKFTKNRVKKSNSHVVSISVSCFYLRIILFRIYTKCNVRWQSPWSCCPCENICVLVFNFKTNNRRTLFYVFVSLSHFLCRQRSTTTRTVRHDLKSFIKKSFIPDLLQCPPLRLNKCVVISNIRIIHISPETYSIREILPHTFVFPHTLFTLFDKWLNTIFLNLILSVKAKSLLNLQLDRQSVSIPSGLSRNFIPLHGTVTRNHILDNTCQNMADMRFTIRSRRSIIKHILWTALTVLHTLLKNMIVFPEFLRFLLPVNKIHVC